MPWLTMLWVGGLLVPIGYYAGRSGLVRPGIAPVALMGLLIVGLVIIPGLAGFVLYHPLEWLAGIAGGVGGYHLANSEKAQTRQLAADSR